MSAPARPWNRLSGVRFSWKMMTMCPIAAAAGVGVGLGVGVVAGVALGVGVALAVGSALAVGAALGRGELPPPPAHAASPIAPANQKIADARTFVPPGHGRVSQYAIFPAPRH